MVKKQATAAINSPVLNSMVVNGSPPVDASRRLLGAMPIAGQPCGPDLARSPAFDA